MWKCFKSDGKLKKKIKIVKYKRMRIKMIEKEED